jgi:uncharacterized protein involved in tolerance to divalent cations
MSNIYSLIISTAGSLEEVDKIASALIHEKLAACVQSYKIKSHYFWKGEVKKDDEHLLMIKSKTDDYSEIEACIKKIHTYEIPEIIQLPVSNGLPEYLKWINEVTK